MNLIDYNKAVEALEKERQLLLNREQYGAEDVLVHHALNVIAELPIIRQPEIVRCKDCKHRTSWVCNNLEFWECEHLRYELVKWGVTDDWFCADGKRKDE